MSVKATADDTNQAFTLLEADEPPGFGPPMHIHRDAAEAFYVLAGEYNIFVRDEEYACPAGSFIYIPAGEIHVEENASDRAPLVAVLTRNCPDSHGV